MQRYAMSYRPTTRDPVRFQVRMMSTPLIEGAIAYLDSKNTRVHQKDPNRRRRAHLHNLLIEELSRRIDQVL